jgi:adenylosuccinate synthase|tara:strand:- start:3694 stop:4965 length:1272 start_codon:yes stop_codon:yes gene_type:complete
MKVDVLLGLQWGDEGKGKIVDVLTPNYKVIARFQGGPNAGHTLKFKEHKHVLHTIPSGIFRDNAVNVIGNGVVIDPIILQKELDALAKLNVPYKDRLVVSRKAHLILPTHRMLDAASEAAKGKDKIGSTLKGIGPTYMDKTGRNGLRVGDIETANFNETYSKLKEKHLQMLSKFDGFVVEGLGEMETTWMKGIELLRSLTIVNSEYFLSAELEKEHPILAEGAQGSLLDIDFGSYPFVTSSNTISAGACTGLGIAPNKIGEVFGIFKAYCTRVGSGPFPTELFDNDGEILGKVGNEFGATTGRPRRCGWVDLPALKYAVMLNGVTKLIMMKADVLSAVDTIKVCTHYNINGDIVEELPFDINANIDPVYKEFPSWKIDLTGMHSVNELPVELTNYIEYLENELQIPIVIVSVGPDREQTIERI